MALNLSTLTSPATSGDVLAEALTTADFLEPVPVLRNLARGSQKGGDAKQDVALNQPKALPLIKNPQGNLGGYLYIPDVAGNYATGPSVTIGSNQTWEGEVDMVIAQWGGTSPNEYILPMGGGDWSMGFGLIFYPDGDVRAFSKGVSTGELPSGVTLGTPFNAKYGYDGTNRYVKINNSVVWSDPAGDQSASITKTLEFAQTTLTRQGNYAIQKAKLTVNNAVVFDCDFNGSTSIRHGDTKFKAAVGGPVTINQAGNDPATIIKKPVLRFDGANNFLSGVFNQTITGSSIFMAYSVLGDGGVSGRLLGLNSTGANDNDAGGYFLARDGSTTNVIQRYNGGSNIVIHAAMYDDAVGDVLLEANIKNGSQISKLNNANQANGTTTVSGALSSEEFKIASFTSGSNNAAIDLEFLALFSADSVPDEATASKIRNYINNRNNVFYRWDTDGYYFFDPQKADFTGNFTNFGGGNRLDGYITGSDNGDTDVRSNLTLIQVTGNDQPSTDGYTITFHDNAEHLEFKNGVSQNLSGWQICGTSLGTFAYRVQGAVSELNLLGNAGAIRSIGDLYGIILLPASATGKDIEDARKLLIDRGAADSVSASSVQQFWQSRNDIVEFKQVDTSSVTSFREGWRFCASLEIFPPLQAPNCTNFLNAWEGNSSLNSFGAIDASSGTTFVNAWKSCSALTSFPSGAKLGTAANNVNFTSAWKASGITSFPALDLSNGSNFTEAWAYGSLTSFSSGAKLGTNSQNVNFSSAWISGDFTSFPALDLSKGNNFSSAFQSSNLTSFPAGINMSNGTNFANTWRDTDIVEFPLLNLDKSSIFLGSWRFNNLMTTFPAGFFDTWNPNSMNNYVFQYAFSGCVSLTSESVQNILVSINASGQYPTSDGNAGSSGITYKGIDIDYNGDSLSAATNAAVTSLKAKGWSIIVNNVTL